MKNLKLLFLGIGFLICLDGVAQNYRLRDPLKHPETWKKLRQNPIDSAQ